MTFHLVIYRISMLRGSIEVISKAAKLPTVIIQGKGKSMTYEVGDKDFTNLNSQWCAVYVDGDWRIVYVLWSFRAEYGFNQGTWTGHGEPMNTDDEQSSGKRVTRLNEYYFLTDPEEFIYKCRPDEDSWQLLNSPWSMDKYTSVPYCRQDFFSSGLKITSENNCILKSEKGKCWIEFEHDPDEDQDLIYEFCYNEEASGQPLPSDRRLNRFVAYNNEVNKKSFVIRFPCVGVYKIVISQMVEFRLDCTDIGEYVEEFPENPQIGYGYGQTAQWTGITSTNQNYGFISLRPYGTKTFKFVVEDPKNIRARFKNSFTDTDLSSYVHQTVSDNGVSVQVRMAKDQEGDCVLSIRHKKRAAINYLVSFDNIVKSGFTPPKQEENCAMLELPLIQSTVSEITSYRRPKPFIHDVMKTTYLILGEREKRLKKWKGIQRLTRKQGRESLIRRIEEFDLANLRIPAVNRSDTLLDMYDKRTICFTSAGAGTFYKWSRNTVDDVRQEEPRRKPAKKKRILGRRKKNN